MSAAAKDRLIVALDQPTMDAALAQVDGLGELVGWYKVGLELYIAEGRRMIDALKARGKRVFLDLKLHDIPETVRRAAQVVSGFGVDLLTVHASGGQAMLEAAVAGAGTAKVLAVTVLTSLDEADLRRDNIGVSTQEQVLTRARLAQAAGCAGVIASPLEAAAARALDGRRLMIVTPGVRRAPTSDDQKRVATPKRAIADGADAIVVGRPIRDGGPDEARRILEELA